MTTKKTNVPFVDHQAQLRQAFRVANRRRREAELRLLAAGVLEYELARHLRHLDLTVFSILRCGAKTRSGTPCKQKGLYTCGRCRLHGGLSTGPRTPEGKSRSAANGHLRSEPHESLRKPNIAPRMWVWNAAQFGSHKPPKEKS